MKIEIIGNPISEATINLDRFKNVLRETLDLENAVRSSLMITYKQNHIKDEDIIHFVYLGFDWRKGIDSLKDTNQSKIRIKIFNVKFEDWTRYIPSVISQDLRTIELSERVESGKDIILITDYFGHPSTIIKMFIDRGQFQYGGDMPKWFISEN